MRERGNVKAELLQVLVDAAKDAIFMIDTKGNVSYMNDAAEEMFGYSRKELMGENLHRTLAPKEYHPAHFEAHKRFQKTGEGAAIGATVELTALRKDGSEFPMALSLSSVHMGDGWHAVGVIRDVSDQKAAEEEQRRYAWALGERMKELSCLYGIGALVEQPGIRLEAVYKGVVDLIPPSWQHPEVTCARLTIGDDEFTTEAFRESEWRQSSDVMANDVKVGVLDVFYLEEMPRFDEGPFQKEERALINEIVDRLGRFIEQRGAEEALTKSEEQYRRLWEESGDGLVLVSPEDGRILDCNAEYLRQTGRSRKELLSMKIWELRPPDQREAAREMFQEVKKAGTGASMELAYLRPDGGLTQVDFLAEDILIGGRRVIQSRTRDITQWVELRRQLEESEERYRVLVDMVPVGISTVNLTGFIKSTNPAMAEMTGFDRDEIVGKHFTKLGFIRARDMLRNIKLFAQILRGEIPPPLDNELMRKDGSRLDLEVHMKLIGGLRSKSGIQVVAVDVTDRKEAEKILGDYADDLQRMVAEKAGELVDAERMAAAGRVAAMFGHDLRGPLQAISNAAYMVKMDPEGMARSLEIIEESVAMASSMLGEFRESTRDTPPTLIPVDLGGLVGRAVEEAGVPSRIEVSVEVDEGLGDVSLDPGKIRRFMDNLISNAVDAMPRGGGLRVSAGREGGEAVVRVRDSGEGIPDAVMENMFKPFNTSKAGGTGLGLSFCKMAVGAHGGRIDVETEVGKGSTFTVRLPA